METRRRFNQIVSLNDHLATAAIRLRNEADSLQTSGERDALIRKARQAETATRIASGFSHRVFDHQNSHD